MLQKVILPQLGQTMEEGKIEKWHKTEGDTVRKGDVLFEVTTDKATLEVESFVDGVLKKILASEGETVPVNEVVAVVGEPEDELPADMEVFKKAPAEKATAVPGQEPAKVGSPREDGAATAMPAAAPGAPGGRIFSSPRARKIAAEKHIPIEVIHGTGPNGRIVERDVQDYLEKLKSVPYTPAALEVAFQKKKDLLAIEPAGPGGRITKEDVLRAPALAPAMPEGEKIELSAMRQTIAARMSRSKQTSPHFYLVGDVRMKAAQQFRDRLNAQSDSKVSVTALLVKAVALGLKRHPRVNARFSGDTIVLNPQANVGVAVAVEGGLFVPVIRNADKKEMAQIAAELKELAALAREGKLTPAQYEGGSITLSNLGMFGVDCFLPIINPPESCIIGVGQISDQVVARDGAMAIEPVMKLSLSADHRVIDGAEAAAFFQTLNESLTRPEQLAGTD